MVDQATHSPPRIVAGCMTGTSLDGIDVALVRIDGKGLDMTASLIGHHATPMPADLRDTLMHLASGGPAEPIVYLRAARQLGLFHADALAELFAQHPDAQPDFVTAHGQTIWHAPKDSKDLGPMSWQLFDPWPIVQRHKLPVCYDLRQADLIAGGEGAPLTPIADWVMYRSDEPVRVVLNLGGVANGTLLYDKPELTQGQDICACNLVIDRIVRLMFPDQRYDKDGEISRQGNHKNWNVALENEPYMFRPDRKDSLGRESLTDTWFDGVRAERASHSPDEGFEYAAVGTAVETVARSICAWLKLQMPYRVVVAGGGAKNRTLIEKLRVHSGLGKEYLLLSDDLGIPCEAREAMGWAVLGALSQDGVPVSLPQVTGATEPGVAGVWARPF